MESPPERCGDNCIGSWGTLILTYLLGDGLRQMESLKFSNFLEGQGAKFVNPLVSGVH